MWTNTNTNELCNISDNVEGTDSKSHVGENKADSNM